MRIQHNIPAMNAYRNYNTNVKSLQGNLQKLSSGYKINKAGDDAAGLAISEKMRAQITGLEVAQKNAKDGISLVQTAEGALQEVHTMLNRMYSLAEQSANGTYSDEVDREQLQKEVQSLSEEIDRIADASNFNGKKLLNGDLAGAGSKGGKVSAVPTSLETVTVDATKGKYTTEALAATNTTLDTTPAKLSFAFSDGNGQEKVVEFTITAGAASTGAAADAGKGIYVNGEWVLDSNTAKGVAQGDWGTVVSAAFKKFAPEINDNFNISFANNKVTFEAKEAGAGTMQLTSYNYDKGGALENAKVTVDQEANDAFDTIDVSKIHKWDGTETDLEKSIFEVGGEKFVLYSESITALNDDQKALLAKAGVGNNAVKGDANAYTSSEKLVPVINQATGISAKNGKVTGSTWADQVGTNAAAGETFIALMAGSAKVGGGSSGGLTLQIGDTSDDYNKMTVSVKDCHAKAIGIGSVDISTESGASDAMKSIKDAINYVSDVRGTLGALQNRLDHTINNLSVQQENIQDAEATIRDVDVANEMMAYTKNNILVQSAQAMLAQANQLPQGVLQLLG